MRNGKREHSSLEMDVNVCLATLATDKTGRSAQKICSARCLLPVLASQCEGRRPKRTHPVSLIVFRIPRSQCFSPFRIRIDICMLYTRQGKARSSLSLSFSLPPSLLSLAAACMLFSLTPSPSSFSFSFSSSYFLVPTKKTISFSFPNPHSQITTDCGLVF